MGRTLLVLLQGAPVGHLSEDDAGRISFRFTEEYRHLPARQILSQSFEDDLRRVYRRKDGLPAFFANLIPEGPLRDLIEEDAGISKGDDLALLAAVGRDLPGAVEIRPGDPREVAPNDIVDEDEAETLWAAGKHAEDGELRFSLAGVQLKFSVLRQGDKMTLPAHGMGGEWIAKLDSSRFPHVVENEYAVLEWARAAGFEVPECHIYPTTALSPSLRRFAALDRSLLLIRRYDRHGAVRIHQEDLAQVIGRPPRQKYDAITYEQCAALVRANVGEEGYFEFIRRLAFVVATGNNDAHLKNWSFVYPNGINAELSPLYDQVCTIAWPEVRNILALPLLKNRYPARIEESTFSRLAIHAGEDSARTLDVVRVTLRRIAASWRLSAGIEVMPSDHFTALLRYWRKVPLLRAYTEELVGT